MSVVFRPKAESDVEVAVDDIGRWQASAVDKFVRRVDESVAALDRMPFLAPVHEPEAPEYPGMRVYVIPRDYGYLIFYQPTADGISVARVLHRSRNIPAIFNPTPDPT